MTASRRATVAAALLAGLVLVGCAGEQPTTSARPDGSESTTPHEHAHSELAEPDASADWNAADATYLTMMIGHHRQALDMSRLAPSRAADRRVRALARTIDAGQGREIIVMATWLVDHDYPEPTLDEVEAMSSMGGMPGMLAPTQMTALADADGAAFDRLYLSGMIQHHQGAIGMAEDVLGAGEDERVNQMAAEVIATQFGEIRRMRDLLATLP